VAERRLELEEAKHAQADDEVHGTDRDLRGSALVALVA
jgi:hypothetical protein